MGESGTGRMQVTSASHHSSASLSKLLAEANGDCKNVNRSVSRKCSDTAPMKLSSEEVGMKFMQNGFSDVELCPKGHVCHKCSSSLFGDTSLFYGAQDYLPGCSPSFTKTRSAYNNGAVMDESGTDIVGNLWLGAQIMDHITINHPARCP